MLGKRRRSPSVESAVSSGSSLLSAPDYHASVPKLEELDVSDIPEDFSITLFGRKNTGKTTWNQWFLSTRYPLYDDVLIMSSTAFTGKLAKWVHNKVKVVQGFDDERLGALIKFAEMMSSNGLLWRTLIILDDVLDDKKVIRKSVNLDRVCTMAKHLHFSIITCSHDKHLFTPPQRENQDAIGIFKTISRPAKESFWLSYGGDMPRDEFFAMLKKYTENRGILFILPFKNTDEVQAMFKYSRAAKLIDQRMLFRDTPLPPNLRKRQSAGATAAQLHQ